MSSTVSSNGYAKARLRLPYQYISKSWEESSSIALLSKYRILASMDFLVDGRLGERASIGVLENYSKEANSPCKNCVAKGGLERYMTHALLPRFSAHDKSFFDLKLASSSPPAMDWPRRSPERPVRNLGRAEGGELEESFTNLMRCANVMCRARTDLARLESRED